tara:strand:- start:354 stop:788 length:435 start_codon:yes stop_codon:yes gene_type:complete
MDKSFDVQAHWEKYWGNSTPYHRDILQLELLGWDLDARSAKFWLPYRTSFDNGPVPSEAVIHGGVIASFVDSTTGFALAMAARHPGGPTIDLRLDCLAPAYQTGLTGEAKVIKLGRRIGVADVSITNDNGKLVAVGRQTAYLGP